MQVFVKFSVGLDAVELLKQIDDLGESRHVVYVHSLSTFELEEETQCPVPMRELHFPSVFSFLSVIERKVRP